MATSHNLRSEKIEASNTSNAFHGAFENGLESIDHVDVLLLGLLIELPNSIEASVRDADLAFTKHTWSMVDHQSVILPTA